MPKEVEDESAALNQFKTEFNKRYCREKPGPSFSTSAFGEVLQEAFGGSAETRKALGKRYFLY